MQFDYAHNGAPERSSRTAGLSACKIPERITDIRTDAVKREIPVSSEETLTFLRVVAAAVKPERILEIGTAVGVSGLCLLDACKSARLCTLEINQSFADEARRNFALMQVSDRVELMCGDAGEIIKSLTGKYSLIFLDGPKVQYVKYLPELVRLLEVGGVLFADDVLLYGWVNGESAAPPKRRMLVQHIREYIQAANGDSRLETSIIDIGDGVALSVKKYE